MKRFSVNGMRAVNATRVSEAAEVFAERMARKAYGASGEANSVNLESWSEDGRAMEYSAFLTGDDGSHCVRFTVNKL